MTQGGRCRRPRAATSFYAEWLDEQTTVAGQREGGITRALLSNGGELELLSQLAGGDEPATLRMLLEDKLELIERYPGDFGLMADANPFDEACRPLVEEALDRHGAKAISVATSWGDGAERRFLDDPACEWLWELALERDVAVHLHPPMLPFGQELQLETPLYEAEPEEFLQIRLEEVGLDAAGDSTSWRVRSGRSRVGWKSSGAATSTPMAEAAGGRCTTWSNPGWRVTRDC
jgi:hypothetical protein